MTPDYFNIVLQSAVGGIISGVAFWATVKVEIKYLRRDVDFLLGKHNKG